MLPTQSNYGKQDLVSVLCISEAHHHQFYRVSPSCLMLFDHPSTSRYGVPLNNMTVMDEHE